ncbi:adenylate kinase and related kinase [Paenibacillus marinisediminis]
MNRQLLQETQYLLEQQLPKDAAIRLSMAHIQSELAAMADILTSYEMEQRDQCVLLGCYWLLLQAMRSHEQLPSDPQAAARAVLDGDFLQSFYLQFALRHQFLDLVTDLASTIKEIQIRRAEKTRCNDLLYQRFVSFVKEQYSRRHIPPQRFKQVTYDVI